MSWSAPPVKPSPVSSPVSMASYTGSSNASGSSREGSPAYSKLDKSNYMNVTNDGLFPGENHAPSDNNNNMPSDDMALMNGGNPAKHRLAAGMMYTGDTRSLPNGLPPGSVAKYNMTDHSKSPTTQQFLVEHLASFPQDANAGYMTPTEALARLKQVSTGGGLWAQKMSMNITSRKLIMANGETMDIIEEYPFDQISLCITCLDDPMFENLLIFSTKLSQDKVGAVHLFQCKTKEATVISEVINKQRELKAANLSNGLSNGGSEVMSISSSDRRSSGSQQTRTEYNLQQRHAVARAVEAFQTNENTAPQKPERHFATTVQMNGSAGGNVSQIQDAKITRDVQILNKCIEEVENFVVMLKRINEARKMLQSKKKGSKKKKVEDILQLQAQPPPDHRIFDIYQKFKHALNLLGKLQPHINEPNAPELVHYLFIPLGIIVKVTGIEKARPVVEPLLTATSVDLLEQCLDSKNYQFWQSLGPNWTLTKSSDRFKDRYFNLYIPIFIDGWIPPEIVANEKQGAAAKSTAVMVARMQGRKTSAQAAYTKSTVILAAMKFKQLGQQAREKRQNMSRSTSSSGILQVNTADIHNHHLHQRNNSIDSKPQYRLVGIVVYDYLAHNNKELTIRAGEKVHILDNSRRWWLVRNGHGEQGYVPSTVLEIPATDSGNSSPINDIHGFTQTNGGVVMNGNSGMANGHIHHQTQTSSVPYSPKFDSNQNYVNDNSLTQHHQQQQQPQQTTTPVIISVRLPDGSNVQSNIDGTHIIATPAGMNTSTQALGTSPQGMGTSTQGIGTSTQGMGTSTQEMGTSAHRIGTSNQSIGVYSTQGISTSVQTVNTNGMQNSSGKESPAYAVVKKKPVSAQTSNGFSSRNYQKTTVVTQTQTASQNRMSPPKTAAVPPPPAPPPPPVPPPVSPKPQSFIVSKEANLGSVLVGSVPEPNSNSNFNYEPKGGDLQSELKNRLSLSLNPVEVQQSQEKVPNIDAVDVFIPLYKSSTADDVSRWLFKLGFSERSIDILKGKTALDLFKINKEDMIDLLGNDEGIQLYEELQVQNGAQNRHKTLTEFQRALVRRLQKREQQHDMARAHHQGQDANSTASPSDMLKDDLSKVFENDGASAIRKQKEELERLKKNAREPANATFTSFSSNSSINVSTPQGKTKL
ncbi:epidermal growth factor receptor kinase substrate 8-like isoform X3 [Hydractinia symbiolongicarpus]|uniref:epidermal growth factor receptor kinase substrate 8-like isoform X3 n=1 Tax=Hydractinia symbiolongicarpus TaxID=13093 RepID=UPI0025503EEE|nr:epidermal growth factor receptor kinase substrate 8-like isoform X3 [Hydractinia symbiolongicarpus]